MTLKNKSFEWLDEKLAAEARSQGKSPNPNSYDLKSVTRKDLEKMSSVALEQWIPYLEIWRTNHQARRLQGQMRSIISARSARKQTVILIVALMTLFATIFGAWLASLPSDEESFVRLREGSDIPTLPSK